MAIERAGLGESVDVGSSEALAPSRSEIPPEDTFCLEGLDGAIIDDLLTRASDRVSPEQALRLATELHLLHSLEILEAAAEHQRHAQLVMTLRLPIAQLSGRDRTDFVAAMQARA